MTEPPFVSVILPAYQDQAGVDACLAALAAQTYPADRFEVILVDNGSDPPLRGRAPPAGPRVVVCRTAGAYAARNAGVRAARGEFLAFTDADCVPDPDWLAAGVAALAEGDDVVAGGDVRVPRSSRPTAVELYQSLTGFGQRDNIERLGYSVTANLFARRAHFDRVGEFSEDLLSGGDLDWSKRAAGAGLRLRFAADALVTTRPRATLADAIRQARRVAGGRRRMRRMSWAAARPPGPKRPALEALGWILRYPGLGPVDRLRVLAVAVILRLAGAAETLRLRLGGRAERR